MLRFYIVIREQGTFIRDREDESFEGFVVSKTWAEFFRDKLNEAHAQRRVADIEWLRCKLSE